MATPSIGLIRALRLTAAKISLGADYQWGHMGACNCGNLAQELTSFSKEEIHSFAMQRCGDWNEQLVDYCPSSGIPMDLLIDKMCAAGLTVENLKHLEWLSDPRILRTLPEKERYLQHNNKKHVVKYFLAWAELLEQELLSEIHLDGMKDSKKDLELVDLVGY